MGKIREFIRLAPPTAFDEVCAMKYGELKAHLAKLGKPCGEVDTFIAAAALAGQARLVTKNLRHFENVPGLELEDWLS